MLLASCSSVLFEITVKSNKAHQFENRTKGILRKLQVPIPSTCQWTINAAAGIIEIVDTTAIKGAATEIVQNVHAKLF
jgi:hypothetical protein